MVRVVMVVKVVRLIRVLKKHPRTEIKNLKISKDFYDSHDALAFGRPGCGAPARTKSGRIRTTLIGNPDIRLMVMMMMVIILIIMMVIILIMMMVMVITLIMMMMMTIILIMMMVMENQKLQPIHQVPGQRGCAKVNQQQH